MVAGKGEREDVTQDTDVAKELRALYLGIVRIVHSHPELFSGSIGDSCVDLAVRYLQEQEAKKSPLHNAE
jgi:hypothetical protein